MPYIQITEMKSEFKRILVARGCEEDIAEISARLFAEASCDGVCSHGVNRFPRVIDYVDKGYINLNAKPSKAEGTAAFERWNGNLGLGNYNATLSMERAIALARDFGIGCVALSNTNHWMRGGAYGFQAAESGCVGICWTNTKPNMPVWGGRDCRIGNNPLIMAVPREEGHVVVDMALAQYSYGQMESIAMRNEMLDVHGGYDQQGALTCDPREIAHTGRVLPIGYWKGSALSIVMDLIVTVLSGGRSTMKVGGLGNDEYGLSQIFIAIDTSRIEGQGSLASAVNEVLEYIKESELVLPSQAVRYPGERTMMNRKNNLAHGIPVEDSVWSKIQAL